MLVQEHPSGKLSDYVLDLLSPGERQHLERHLASCARCRQALREERTLLRDVRQTLDAASIPSSTRLNQLMPPVPKATRRRHFEIALRPALAFSVVVALFVLSLQIYMPGTNDAIPPPTATYLAATATSTPTTTVESRTQTEAPNRVTHSAAQSLTYGTPLAALYSSAHN